METIKIRDYEIIVNKKDSIKTFEVVYDKNTYIGNLSSREYNILKEKSLDNAKDCVIGFSFDPKFNSFIINVQIDVPYTDDNDTEEFQICTTRKEIECPESFNIEIDNYKYSIVKNNDKMFMFTRYNNIKYIRELSKENYDMFKKYKNGELKDVMITRCSYCGIRIECFGFENYIYLNTQSTEDKLREEIEELKKTIEEMKNKQ